MMRDIALVLPTSGTSGTPKLVSLTSANVQASTQAWVQALDLTAKDLCLNIMPIWHGSLISNVLASNAVGATVVNVPKPSPMELWALIEKFKPTWLPLPAGLAEQILGDERIPVAVASLRQMRFVRLSKASLSESAIFELGCIFRCPILQSYGMTEAASGPVSCETLKCRRPGSVGKPIHLEVSIDRDHQILIRGASVMHEYAAGPPNRFVFTGDGWMQTGDLGYFDEDGFLYLTGRMPQ